MTLKPILIAISLALTTMAPAAVWGDSDVSHNWTTEAAAEAMSIFRDKYVELGGVWKETAFPDTEQSISSVKTRFIGGQPPMALQSALAGKMEPFAKAGLLQNMDELAKAENWAGRLSAGTDRMAQYEGHWVAAPVSIDVINWLYTNNEVLADNDIQTPNTWEEFKATLPLLKDAGVIPIAVGGSSWQEAILFDHVLLAIGGAEMYEGVMTHDAAVIESAVMAKVLREFVALRDFTDEGRSGRSWNDSNTLLLSGKAAYFFMGPWAAGGYDDLGDEGTRWSCRLTPWSDTLTVVADGFQFIKVTDEADLAAQKLFASAVMDPATQIAAAKAKSSIPAVVGADPSSFVGCPAKAIAAMQTDTVLMHWNGQSVQTSDAIKDAVSALWNESIDVQAAQQQLIKKLK